MMKSALSVAFLALSVGAFAAAPPPIVTAAKNGDAAAVRALIARHADVNAAEADGTTALLWAVQHNDSDMAGALLTAKANANAANRYGIAPLAVACTNGNAAIIEKLLRAGADANATTREGETPLMIAARTGRVDAVKTLLVHGADANAKERLRGQTALMWAAAENNAAAATALLEAHADLNARSNGGFDALLFAIRAGSLDTVNVLLDAGASANDTMQPPAPRAPAAGRGAAPGGATAAAPAAGRGAASAAPPRPAGNDAAQLLAVFNTGLRRGRGGNITSALVLAITNAHYELASVLLDRGADPNGDTQGWTALHQIAWNRKPPIQHGMPPAVPTGNMSTLELAKKLLEKGANPNARQTSEPNDGARNILNRIGSTPFLQAAKLGDVDYMRLLLAHGADPSITTEEGATPLMAAAGVGNWQDGESAGSHEG